MHTAYPMPIRRGSFACPVVTTLHDLYPWDEPHNFGYPRVLLQRLVLAQCLRAVDAIACVSFGTQHRLGRHNPTLASRTCCIPNMVDAKEAQEPTEAAWMQPLRRAPFLLCVAQHRRNKNLPLTLAIFHHLLRSRPALRLLLVGNAGPETPSLHALLDGLELRNRVVLVSGISEAQMQWSYRNCEALLATSTNEGFGLPVAEAMLAGCPVVCSDIPAFREFAQDGCHLVPLSSDAIAQFSAALENALTQVRPEARSMPRLKPDVLSQQYLQLYRGVMAPSQPSNAVYSLQRSTTEGDPQ